MYENQTTIDNRTQSLPWRLYIDVIEQGRQRRLVTDSIQPHLADDQMTLFDIVYRGIVEKHYDTHEARDLGFRLLNWCDTCRSDGCFELDLLLPRQRVLASSSDTEELAIKDQDRFWRYHVSGLPHGQAWKPSEEQTISPEADVPLFEPRSPHDYFTNGPSENYGRVEVKPDEAHGGEGGIWNPPFIADQ